MRKHVMAFTYEPKIEGVRNGTIRQTIRPYNPKKPKVVGDEVLFHGWSEKPYRSKWNWRQRETLTEVINILVFPDAYQYSMPVVKDDDGSIWQVRTVMWNGEEADDLARLDGIDPPTGLALREFLVGNYVLVGGKFFQVIRW